METAFHRAWDCPCNRGDAQADKANGIARHAARFAEVRPALWLRGIVPADHIEIPALAEERTMAVAGAAGGENAVVWAPENGALHIFGDASGGANASDARYIRVGWSVAVGSWEVHEPLTSLSGKPCIDFVAGWLGTMGTQPQKVPRGEVYAFLQALVRSEGDFSTTPTTPKSFADSRASGGSTTPCRTLTVTCGTASENAWRIGVAASRFSKSTRTWILTRSS